MKNRKTLIKLKKFILEIKNLSNTELLEEYRKSNSDIDYNIESGMSNNIEYDRNSIIQMCILHRMGDNKSIKPDFFKKDEEK